MIKEILDIVIIYNLIGFIFGLIMLTIIYYQDTKEDIKEFDSHSERCLVIIICMISWIILIPTIIIYRIYNKLKGGK